MWIDLAPVSVTVCGASGPFGEYMKRVYGKDALLGNMKR